MKNATYSTRSVCILSRSFVTSIVTACLALAGLSLRGDPAYASDSVQSAAPPESRHASAPPTTEQQGGSTQQPTQTAQPKIAVEVKTVTVLVSVRDRHGKIIANLTKDDFSLDEDGRSQSINYFVREGNLPLKLGLLVDTSLSQRNVLEQERNASYSFLDHLLRPDKDLAFVIHFDHEVELLQDFTALRPKLQAALQSLEIPQYQNTSSTSGRGDGDEGGGRRGRGGQRRRGGGTLLYDSIYLAANEVMRKQQGRKAVIVLSDGVDRGSKETLVSAIESAQRADLVVYSILFADEEQPSNFGGYGRRPYGGGWPGAGGHGGRFPQEQRPDGKKILEEISKATGGRLFKVSKKDTLEKIYAEVDEDLRNQYSLAYTPDKSSGSGYHKIHLVVRDKNLIVQARDGYYSGD